MYRINKFLLIFLAIAVMVGGFGFSTRLDPSVPGWRFQVPRGEIEILSTVRDSKVAIDVSRMPDGYVEIFIGPYGSQGLAGGYKVGSATIHHHGFEITVALPTQLKGSDRLDIRVQGKTRTALALGWFYNMTSGPNGYSENPVMVVTGVAYDKSVSVTLYNLPPNLKYTVYMGSFSDLRRGFRPDNLHIYQVGTLTLSTGGTTSATFNIPSQLIGEDRMALAMHATGSSRAWTWFWNFTR